MSLKIWTLGACEMQAISDPNVSDVWTLYTGSLYFYSGVALRVSPLCVYYGDTKLTQVYSEVALSGSNVWYWGALGGRNTDTVYVNVNANPDAITSEVMYCSTMTTVIDDESTKSRICVNARISNNSDETVYVRTAMYNDSDVYIGNILPVLTVPVGKLVDDNSRLAIPPGYKYKVEASSTKVSILVSGDEY